MSQSVVTVRLNGTPYQIGCGAGEEERVARLGAEVEDILQSLVGSVGQIGEARLLAMVALILADRASETDGNIPEDKGTPDPNGPTLADANDTAATAAMLEDAARRITALVERLS